MKTMHFITMIVVLGSQGWIARAQDAGDAADVFATTAPVAEVATAGEIADTPKTTSDVQPLDMPDGLDAGSVSVSDDSNLISISLDDVEMVDVVRMFTRISDANIIATASNLTGKVTVNLTDVEWRPALISILDMQNLALIEKTPGSEIYSIVRRSPDAPEPLLVETFFLNYASVAEVQTAIQPVLAPVAKMSTFPSRNALVIKTTAPNLDELKTVIASIDKLREQVFIETKFLELNDEAIKDLGINWQALEGLQFNFGDLEAGYNSEKISTSEQEDILTTTLQDKNVGTTTSVDSDAGKTKSSTFDGRYENTRDFVSTLTDDYLRTIEQTRTAILDVDQFNIVLSALKQMNGVSVVSNPKVIVANEEPATIHIGETERPFIATVTPATDSANAFTTYNPGDPVEYGVKLTVTPTVNTSSNITVRIEPELTRFVANSEAPTGQTYPIISTKRIVTQFCLEHGKTVAIGGLTESEDRENIKKIPLLGYIPLIGKYLFSHEHTERIQRETIIFVTVGLATPEGILPEQGLPQDTELAQMRLLKQKIRRMEYQAELAKAREAADAAEIKSLQAGETVVDEADETVEDNTADSTTDYAAQVREAFGEESVPAVTGE